MWYLPNGMSERGDMSEGSWMLVQVWMVVAHVPFPVDSPKPLKKDVQGTLG